MLDSYQTIEKINNFKRNPPFECDYREDVINSAILISNSLDIKSIKYQNVFPGLDGEMQIIGYYSTYYLEFTIESNLMITCVIEDAGYEILYMENQDLKQAISILSFINFINT